MKNIIYILKLFLSRVTIGIYIVAVSSANLMSSPALAETSEIDIAHINSLFQQAAIDSGAVGVQLSIIKGGQQFDFVHGSANTELNLPMTQDTVIQIGSTTKVFNAAIVMSMVEEDLLDLDVPVKHYIPEFSVADAKATESLTLRHLLSMSSGLDNGPYVNYGEGPNAIGKYVANLKMLPQAFEPGKYFGYSNAGITVAGYVAERVAGKPWETLLKERILDPAGLKNAITLHEDLMFQRVSVGHKLGGEVIRPWSPIGRAQAPTGGSLAMSAHDLARFGQLFINEGVTADTETRVLSKTSVKTMMTPHIDVPTRKYGHSWCLGPLQDNWQDVTLWGHGGTNISGGSFIYWIPEYKGVISVVVNTTAAKGKLLDVIFSEVMQAAFGISKPKLKIPNPTLALSNTQRFVGTYEALGSSMRVYKNDEKLFREFSYNGITTNTEELIPMGGDRFLVGGISNLRGVTDMAFYGEDEQGRATNALNLVFPLRRTD